MFDLTATGSSVEYNSGKNRNNPDITGDSSRNIAINCPSVITGMSHELRTHMNAIVAFSYLMKDNSCSNSDREEFSNQILNSCEQMIGLFDSFLDSAIVDIGNTKTDSRICKFSNLLDDLYIEFREILNREGLSDLEFLTENHQSDLSELVIDKHRIFRVLRCLFNTAVRNTRSGYIRIGYRFRDESINFFVIDSGQGFFKCKEFLHTTDLNESLVQHNDMFTAINLTLAKKLIKILGGTIWIESNGITGTGIYFSVPSRSVPAGNMKINKLLNSVIAI
jgi:signal transduction histidine kinase